jgi:hypothetical protein
MTPDLSLRPAILNGDALRFYIAELAQPLPKGLERALDLRVRTGKALIENPLEATFPPAALRRRAAWRGHQPARSAGSGGGPLFDHLIRPLEECRRDRQAEGLRGLEIDD